MNIGIFIQARLSSRRLPAKMLTPLASRPLLWWVLQAVEQVQTPTLCAVLTSNDASDDPLAEFCQAYGVNCFRGSLNNVAERFLQAAEFYGVEAFVRINGDSPFMSPHVIEQGMEKFVRTKADFVTNVMPRTFPKGVSVEMLTTALFAEFYPQFTTEDDFEHVTQFFYRHPHLINIQNFAAPQDWSEVRFVVDTAEDLARIGQVADQLTAPPWAYSLEGLIALYQQGSAL